MAFDRPGYFKRVLKSLLRQSQDIRKRRIVLYLDGAVSGLTGKRYARDEDVQANRRLFARMIPWGEDRASPINLGVALNFRRAEEELFADPANRIVYFFEDDLVVHRRYLDLLDNMAALTENLPRPVGYFAAYGELKASLRQQYRVRHKLRRLQHHWGFGLRRSHWLAMQPMLAHYYQLLEGNDYPDRPTSEILSWMHAHGVRSGVSSQDDVKKALTYALGALSLNTSAAAGKYIGRRGLHMNPAAYRRQRYAWTMWLWKVDWSIEPPTPEWLEAMLVGEMTRRPPATGEFHVPELPAD